ncbi:hypothetical protein F4677DRAFT_311845 [Hypoxylon crocopeplum]|nr:hypothetical protein F4677DRAFT_311845 [Hypoxylon crocopeplum]
MASRGSGKEIQLSAREMEILAKTFQCFDEPPKINWQKLADIAPFKNVQTARACFAPIKKKLLVASGASGASGQGASGPPSTPTKGRKRKSDTEKTPGFGKKAKTPSKVLRSIKDSDDEDEIHAKIKAELKKAKEEEQVDDYDDEDEDYEDVV